MRTRTPHEPPLGTPDRFDRRRLLAGTLAPWVAGATASRAGDRSRSPDEAMLTVHTFGDSVLDCGRYNDEGLDPGRLLIRNDDRLFPDFVGRDLRARGPARLDHRAVDGATVASLPAQARGLRVCGRSVALLTIGGNDLLQGLAADTGQGVRAFARDLDDFVGRLPARPVLMASVYDPTFGDDRLNFLGIEPALARANHRRVNAAIARIASRHGGRFVDLHAHFLRGDPSWFTRTIEPSLQGASEVRRCFLDALGA